jgi:hypothetical protein
MFWLLITEHFSVCYNNWDLKSLLQQRCVKEDVHIIVIKEMLSS